MSKQGNQVATDRLRGSPSKRRIKKISLEEVVDQALLDDDACLAATLFEGDTFPKRKDLTRFGLTEINYLALQRSEPSQCVLPRGIIYSIAGGAASNLAATILKSDLSVRHESHRQRQSHARINVILMIHGAIAPNPPVYWDFQAPVDEALALPYLVSDQCELYRKGFHAHNLNARGYFLLGQRWYEKLSCGGGAENTLDTRELAQETYANLKSWATNEGISVNFFVVEAIAPVTGLPHMRIFCDQWPFDKYQGKVELVENFSRPGDNYRPSQDGDGLTQFACQDYPVEKILPLSALNDILRWLMDRDEDIVGIGCSDARQGLCVSTLPDQSIDTLSADGIPPFQVRELRDEHLAGHSEPLGLIMLGANMRKVGCYLLARQLRIARREPQMFPEILSLAWPFIINIPYSIWESNVAAISRALEQLLCVVDQNYRRGLNPLFFTPHVYLKDRHETREISTCNGRPLKGLQFIYPGEMENILWRIRPGYPAFKVNLEPLGMSSRHLWAHYDRRSVDIIDVTSSLRSRAEMKYDKVVNKLLRKNAQARVGVLWPFRRRKLGISIAPNPVFDTGFLAP